MQTLVKWKKSIYDKVEFIQKYRNSKMPPNEIMIDQKRQNIVELPLNADFESLRKEKPDIVYKVLIIGESRIGKTSIIKRLSNNEFKETTISTVGLDFVNADYKIENLHVRLQIWDTAGQENFRSITRNHFRYTKGVVLVYDLTDMDSFEQLEYWIETIDTFVNSNNEIVYLIGNKLDLENQRVVTYEMGKKLANNNSIKFFETSAKTGENLMKIFYNLAIDILENNDIEKINNYQRAIGCEKTFIYNYSKEPVIYLPDVERKKKTRFQRIFNRNPKIKNTKSYNNKITSKSTNQYNSTDEKKHSTIKLDKKLKKQNNANCCTIS